MKKSNIIYITALTILWLIYLVIKPLQGYIYADPISNKPKDFVSAIVKTFDHTDKIETPSLKDIKNIKLKGESKGGSIMVDYNDTAKITFLENNQTTSFKYKIIGDTIEVEMDKNGYMAIKLDLNPTESYNLIIENMNPRIALNPGDSSTFGINNIAIRNNSDVFIYNFSRDFQNFNHPFTLSISDKSKLRIDNLKFKKLSANINNGLLTIENSSHIDSLNADLQGLSHIIIGKYPDDKRVDYLNLSGNLDYYNAHKPK